MAEQFPLPRSGFKVLRLILIGYLHEVGRDRKGVGPGNVGTAVGMDATLVSRNNAFLAAVGLIESEQRGRWRLTEGGAEVARALEYEAPEELREALAPILRSNDFIQRLVTFVRGRGGIEESQFVPHIARTAGVPRKSEFLTGSRAVLELMLEAGLVTDAGGVIQTTTRREALAEKEPEAAHDRPRVPARTQVTVTVNLNLSVADLKSDEAIDALAVRVKRLLDAVSGAAPLADAD